MDYAHRQRLKSNIIEICENLKYARIIDYLFKDEVLTGKDCDELRRESDDFRARLVVMAVCQSQAPDPFRSFINALRCTGQYFIADLLTRGDEQGEDQTDDGDGVTTLTGYVHELSPGIKLNSGRKFSTFKLQTGPAGGGNDAYVPCASDCPDLHRVVLQEYVDNRIAVELRRVSAADPDDSDVPGRKRCTSSTWFRRVNVDFESVVPQVELTRLNQLGTITVGRLINVRVQVLADLQSRTSRTKLPNSSVAPGNVIIFQIKNVADETGEAQVTAWEDMADMVECGKAYELQNVTVKRHGNRTYLSVTDFATVIEVEPLRNVFRPAAVTRDAERRRNGNESSKDFNWRR